MEGFVDDNVLLNHLHSSCQRKSVRHRQFVTLL